MKTINYEDLDGEIQEMDVELRKTCIAPSPNTDYFVISTLICASHKGKTPVTLIDGSKPRKGVVLTPSEYVLGVNGLIEFYIIFDEGLEYIYNITDKGKKLFVLLYRQLMEDVMSPDPVKKKQMDPDLITAYVKLAELENQVSRLVSEKT